MRRAALASTTVLCAAIAATAIAQDQGVVSPGSLTFAARDVGTRSGSQSVTIANPGPGNMTVGAPSLAGAHAGDFSFINGCPDPPAVLGEPGTGGDKCTVAVIFTPSATGGRTATLSIPVTRPSGSFTSTVTLSGTGTRSTSGDGSSGSGGTVGGGGTGNPPGGAQPVVGPTPQMTRVSVAARIRLATARRSGIGLRLATANTARILVEVVRRGRVLYRRTGRARDLAQLNAPALRRALRVGRYELAFTPIAASGRRGETVTRRLTVRR